MRDLTPLWLQHPITHLKWTDIWVTPRYSRWWLAATFCDATSTSCADRWRVLSPVPSKIFCRASRSQPCLRCSVLGIIRVIRWMKVLVLHMHQSYLVTCLSSVMSWISCVFYDLQWCSLVFLEVLITWSLHPNELTPCILINHISPFNHCQSATKVIYNPSGAIFFIISLREWNNFCSLPLNSSLNRRLLYLKCTYLCYAICSSKTLSTTTTTTKHLSPKQVGVG